VKLFRCASGEQPFNGEVQSISTSHIRRVKFNDETSKSYSLTQIKLYSKNQFGINDDESSSSGSSRSSNSTNGVIMIDSDDEDDNTQQQTGKFFNELITHSADELKERGSMRSAFAKAMQHPIDIIEQRLSQMTLDGRPIQITEWPTEDDVEDEIMAVLKSVEEEFDIDARSWGQFKSKFPNIYEWYLTHCRHHDYLTELEICDSDDCKICRSLGRKIRTPVSMRDTILRSMDRPIEDRNNRGHFVPPEKTQAVIINNAMTLNELKKELPKLEKHRFETEIVKNNVEADRKAGGSKLFKGSNVRDVATCGECQHPRPIYSLHSLTSSKNNLSSTQQKKKLDELESFKEKYVCGMPCLVKPFHVKQTTRCCEMVESQYYTFARRSSKYNESICSVCCNDEDIMSTEQIKEKIECGGRTPLPMCKYCLSQNITPPMTSSQTNFVEKSKEKKKKRKRQLNRVEADGYGRSRKR